MSFGNELGNAANKVAKKMGNTKSIGKCALAVGDALSAVVGENIARKFRGNAWTWIEKVESELGKKYWRFLKQSKNTSGLPAGSLVIWNKQAKHPCGHIEIADGQGHLCSDFIRSDKLALYYENPANIIPLIFIPCETAINTNHKVPYDVKVTADLLNIREHADTNSKKVGSAKCGEILTVWAEETKENGTKWGKNAKGFFCLKYTKDV